MKKELVFLGSLFSIGIASAFNGYYGGFSLSDLLSEIDSSTMVLGATLIISFALLSLALSRVFKENKQLTNVISFVLALLITWSVNKTNYNFEDFFYSIGIPTDFLFALLPLIIIGGFIFIGFKLGVGKGIIAFGIVLLLSTFVVYEKEATIFYGIIFIIVGYMVNKKWPKKTP